MLLTLSLLIPYFICVGLLVGILSMLFGIGGGLVIVPAMNFFLDHLGYPESLAMKTAVGTSLITILVSTLNVLRKQHKLGNVPWNLIPQFLPYVLIGATVGLLISNQISGVFLKYLFIVFLCFVILHSTFNKNFKAQHTLQDFKPPHALNRGIVGFIIGCLSILLGIGGNILFVPYLRHYHFPIKNAIAFTVGIMPLLALLGSIGYFIEGWHLDPSTLPPYSVGYVNLPAFILIVMGSFMGAFLGQKLLLRLNDRLQAKAYLFFLGLILLIMVDSTGVFTWLCHL